MVLQVSFLDRVGLFLQLLFLILLAYGFFWFENLAGLALALEDLVLMVQVEGALYMVILAFQGAEWLDCCPVNIRVHWLFAYRVNVLFR